MRPDLYEGAADRHIGAKYFARDRPRGDPRCGLPRRGAAAAAIVADPVFLPVGVVGVPRAETVGDVAVIPRSLVGILDQQLNGGAGGDIVEDTAQNAHRV